MRSYRRKTYKSVVEAELERHVQKSLSVAKQAIDGKFSLLAEMAISLKEFIADVDGVKYELVRNWCLCKWCQMFDPENINFNHWKEELKIYIDRLSLSRIKNKIGKKKHLVNVLVNKHEFNDCTMILDVIASKFTKEHIMNVAQRKTVAKSFADNIRQLIDAIVSRTDSQMYIEKTFKV